MDGRRAGWVFGLLGPLGLMASAGAQSTELRMGFTASWTLPWGQVDGETVVDGIHRDVALALTQRLGWRLRFSRVPQLRAQDDGAADHARRHSDFGCGMHPSWFPHPERYHWSQALFEVGDVLVGRRGSTAPADLADLPEGTRVGTVRGYHYPTLQARFASGELLREDAPDQGSLLRKLMRGRPALAVVSPQVLDWTLRQQPGAPLASWRLPVQQAGYHCAVPKGAPIDAQAVLDALHALQREGEIARIVARYAPAR